jgi:hypothetical protein
MYNGQCMSRDKQVRLVDWYLKRLAADIAAMLRVGEAKRIARFCFRQVGTVTGWFDHRSARLMMCGTMFP